MKKRDLPALRKWFAAQTAEAHIARCMEVAGVSRIFMTNSPFDELERPVWEQGFRRDERFVACLRIDPLLLAWPETAPRLARWGYKVQFAAPPQKTFDEVRRFLADWTKRMQARYLMVSAAAGFRYPARNITSQFSRKPFCRIVASTGCRWR